MGREEVTDTGVDGDEEVDSGLCKPFLKRVSSVEGPGPAKGSVADGASDCDSAAAAASIFFLSVASFLCCSSWSNKESLIASIIISCFLGKPEPH